MKKLTTADFIQKASVIHGNIYDYSSVNYINCKISVKIKCLVHGEFLQSPEHHLNGRGCKYCGIEKQKIML